MKQIIIGLTICPLLVVCLACGEGKEKGVAGNHDVPVALVEVRDTMMAREIWVHGVVSSGEQANLSFKLPGIVRSVRAKEGDAVRRGALLAELDLTEIEAQYAQAQESFDKQRRDCERTEALFRDSVATREQWQNSRTALMLAEQALKVAGYNRQHAGIYAPADGVVLYKYVGEGEYVQPGQAVMQVSLHTDRGLLLKAGVSVSHWRSLCVGDRVEWEAEGFPGAVFAGRVTRVARAADLQSGLYQVEVGLDAGSESVVVGMFAEATIYPQRQAVYKCIPCTCLRDGEGREAYVYVPDGKRVKRVGVTVAFIREGQAYVSAGLESIGRVIHEGAGFLSPYSTISIQ